MNILILDSQILAVDPQENDDSWFTADQILQKSVVVGAALVEVDEIPPDFSPFKYSYVDGELINTEAPPSVVVPQFVSPRQIRQALTRAGLREAVEASVSSGDQDTKDWYEFATEFDRSHEHVLMLAQALDVSESDLDNLWILAASL